MLSNYDHDRRARRDLRGNDLFRYENGLMSKGELSALEAKYHGEEQTERLRQEGEKYWQEYYNSTFDSGSTNSSTNSTNSDSSYYSGGYHPSKAVLNMEKSFDCVDKANYYSNQTTHYLDIAGNTNLPVKTRREALTKAQECMNKSKKYRKGIKKYSNKAAHGGGSWVVAIIIGILIVFFFF